MRKHIVKAVDCSEEKLLKLAKQVGFVVKSGRKHWKVETTTGVFITTVPRHRNLKRELVKGIVVRFQEFGVDVEVR